MSGGLAALRADLPLFSLAQHDSFGTSNASSYVVPVSFTLGITFE